ncbi:MAG TPA: hypothetical protein VMQ44_03510 [Candidatus Saccharimonadales bacterium]|nr:hypothetical protein [Candidatus Saccharimonadales bacterium]
MHGRIWFYLAAIIIIAGLVCYYEAVKNRTSRQVATLERAGVQDQKDQLASYLQKQTDAYKVISLAKQMKNASPDLIEMMADRAYQLDPTNRDVVLLSSAFHPELKSQVLKLDPLYGSPASN